MWDYFSFLNCLTKIKKEWEDKFVFVRFKLSNCPLINTDQCTIPFGVLNLPLLVWIYDGTYVHAERYMLSKYNYASKITSSGALASKADRRVLLYTKPNRKHSLSNQQVNWTLKANNHA